MRQSYVSNWGSPRSASTHIMIDIHFKKRLIKAAAAKANVAYKHDSLMLSIVSSISRPSALPPEPLIALAVPPIKTPPEAIHRVRNAQAIFNSVPAVNTFKMPPFLFDLMTQKMTQPMYSNPNETLENRNNGNMVFTSRIYFFLVVRAASLTSVSTHQKSHDGFSIFRQGQARRGVQVFLCSVVESMRRQDCQELLLRYVLFAIERFHPKREAWQGGAELQSRYPKLSDSVFRFAQGNC